ncbi:MAG: hypothetical protein P4L62_04025 [Candidatus Pacebacteria bacterium]|nr:hypothetical protein [Candidatus Paceibacterota bacterium]
MQRNPEKIERFMAREARQASEALHYAPAFTRKEKRKISRIFSRWRISKILFWLVFLGLIATAAYYYRQYKVLKKIPSSVALTQAKSQSVVIQVGKLMILPQGENPTLATVSDKSKLGNQVFFKNAENGDKILIYANAKVAILYRSSINKIVNVAPLFADQNSSSGQTVSADQSAAQNSPGSNLAIQANSAANPAPSSPMQIQTDSTPAADSSNATINPLKVIIEKGSNVAGTSNTRANLNSLTGVAVIGTGDAKGNYTNTLVVDLTQKDSALVSRIAQAVGGQVQNLPAGEVQPANADVLIIVGSNLAAETTTPNNSNK